MPFIACYQLFFNKKRLIKTLLIMKLTAAFLFAMCLNASANSYAQNLTLSETNSPLEKIFREIKRQNDYTFVYKENLIQNAKKVTIKITNASLEQVLDICFHDQPFTYTI